MPDPMSDQPSLSELPEAERQAWLQAVRDSQDYPARVIAEQHAAQAAADAADKAKSRALIADPTLTADERVERFVVDRVRHNDVSLWADDGNRIQPRPDFRPEFEHIRRCGTFYVDNVSAADIQRGYCATCADTMYGLRFDAACTCGYRQPGLVWEGESVTRADDIFDAMDQALR